MKMLSFINDKRGKLFIIQISRVALCEVQNIRVIEIIFVQILLWLL